MAKRSKKCIFNVVSLVIAICGGLYFSGRSYYYIKQRNKLKEETKALIW